MRFDGPDPWVVLRVEHGNRQPGLARYTDDQQVTFEFAFEPGAERSVVAGAMFESLRRAAELGVPLPIFVEQPGHGEALATQLLMPSFSSLERRRAWEVVRCLADPTTELPEYALPLRIATVGTFASNQLSMFRAHGFVSEALDLGSIVVENFLDVNELASGSHEVIIAGPEDAGDVLLARPALAPRLLVVLAEDGFDRQLCVVGHLRSNRWAERTALITLAPSEQTVADIDSLLLAIVHDAPLHAWVAERRLFDTHAVLFATPATDHGLRMADAFAVQARRELEDAIRVLQPAEIESRDLEDRSTLELSFTFDQEHSGLIPLSRGRRRAESVPESRAKLLRSQQVIVERRRVDARLERVDRVGPIDRWGPAHHAMWVDRDRTLRRGGRYRLRVQIGSYFLGNLISDEIAAVLLPRSEGNDGWSLDVVVFAKDFVLGSTALRSLDLPKHGGSEAVYFDLTAPKLGDAAQLRFGIYLGNHLLQSFQLEAALADEEVEHERGLQVSLDLGTTVSFRQLDTVAPCAASIGVNQNVSKTHTLMVKIGQTSEGITLPPRALDHLTKQYRDILERTIVEGVPMFPAQLEETLEAQREQFENMVRELAVVGQKFYRELFYRASRSTQDTLRAIVRAVDQPIELPHHDLDLSIPWPILYDFTVPAGAANVCDGTRNGMPCGHTIDPGVFCLNGFWGLRHVLLEQLQGRRDSIHTIQRSKSPPFVGASDGIGDGLCSSMVTRLNGRMGENSVVELKDDEDILDRLWKNRPPIFLVLGHLEEREPPRITVKKPREWLSHDDITDRNLVEEPWQQPNSLVLLMACRAMNGDTAALSKHVLALRACGASVIIGPECPITSGFACLFTEELVDSLVKRRVTVGHALTDFRRKLARLGNPLGFALTAFGDTDVMLA